MGYFHAAKGEWKNHEAGKELILSHTYYTILE